MSVVEAASPHLRDFLRFKDDESAAGVGGRRQELAGLIFDAAASSEKQPSPLHSCAVAGPSRTLLDIIRDEESTVGPYRRSLGQGLHGKDRKSWKSFKDRLRLKRAGSTLVPSSPLPSSDVLANKTRRSPESRQGSARFNLAGPVLSEASTPPENSVSMENEARNDQAYDGSSPNSRLNPTRRRSTRFGTLVPISIEPARSSDSSERSLRPQISRQNSTRYTSQLTQSPQAPTPSGSSPISRERSIPGVRELDATTTAEPPRESTRRLSVALAEEREQSAREAAAAQEAAVAEQPAREAAAAQEAASAEQPAREAAAAQEAAGAEQPARMSLMDLLEETDRQITGLEGTSYTMGEDDGAEVAAAEVEEEGDGGGGVERNCCICMVRHRGAAFIPCGHTFCRICSRELWVSRGNCPLCNNHIVEILDIF